jgi:adenylate kinase family enzyme
VGVRNYLIEGMSGAGKTSVAEELERRGYHVIHGDRTLAYFGDPQTGKPLPALSRESVDNITWAYERWIWDVAKVKSVMADESHALSFFCGGSRNAHHYIDLFDGIFVLEVDLDTLKRRVGGRGDDEFGGKPEQWALLARLHATKEGIPKGGIAIDATQPIARVVDAILQKCG